MKVPGFQIQRAVFQLRPALISSPSRLLALFGSEEWRDFGRWVATLINCREIVLTKAFFASCDVLLSQ